MKDFMTVLLASLFVGFVLFSLFSLDRRTQEQGLIISNGKIADSVDELLETILLTNANRCPYPLTETKKSKR